MKITKWNVWISNHVKLFSITWPLQIHMVDILLNVKKYAKIQFDRLGLVTSISGRFEIASPPPVVRGIFWELRVSFCCTKLCCHFFLITIMGNKRNLGSLRWSKQVIAYIAAVTLERRRFDYHVIFPKLQPTTIILILINYLYYFKKFLFYIEILLYKINNV